VETKTKVVNDVSGSTGEPCDDCGADIRAGSLFCYNCGGSVQKNKVEVDAESNGDSKVQRFPRSRPRSQRKPSEVTWRRSDGPGYKLLLVALAAAVLVGLVLAVANYLK
jgi:uncharacterized Zn finger protein (UPF0148 family)